MVAYSHARSLSNVITLWTPHVRTRLQPRPKLRSPPSGLLIETYPGPEPHVRPPAAGRSRWPYFGISSEVVNRGDPHAFTGAGSQPGSGLPCARLSNWLLIPERFGSESMTLCRESLTICLAAMLCFGLHSKIPTGVAVGEPASLLAQLSGDSHQTGSDRVHIPRD